MARATLVGHLQRRPGGSSALRNCWGSCAKHTLSSTWFGVTPRNEPSWTEPHGNMQLVRLADGSWLVLIYSERKVLLVGCWWLVCSERKVPVAQANADEPSPDGRGTCLQQLSNLSRFRRGERSFVRSLRSRCAARDIASRARARAPTAMERLPAAR
jgi:hypothetical protein